MVSLVDKQTSLASMFLLPFPAPSLALAGPNNNPSGSHQSRYLRWDVVSL